MAIQAISLRCLLGLGVLLALPTTTFAQTAPPVPSQPSPPPPTDSASEYRARASAAVDAGNPDLAGRILMLSYQDNGDVEALYVAGLFFLRAGNRDLARQVWNVYLCNSDNALKRREVRLALHDMDPRRAPAPCMDPAPPRRSKTPARTHLERRSKTPARTHIQRRSSSASPDRIDTDPQPRTPWKFELEAGLTFGDNYFAHNWAPGIWVGETQGTRVGLFVPLSLGGGPHFDATIGIEPRVRIPVGEETSLQLAAGAHSADYQDMYSLGAGINFSEVLTLGLTYQALKGDDYYYEDEYDYSRSRLLLNATFTGKTGKTITAIEAGLVLLVAGLAAGG